MTEAIALTHAAKTPPAPPAQPPPPSLDKAVLHLHEPTPDGNSGFKAGPEITTVPFQFNPKELTFSKSAKWPRAEQKTAKKSATPEFSGSEPVKLTLEMFFDATAKHDGSVVSSVESLLSCCMPTEKSIADKHPRPPLVILQWGSIKGITLFVSQVSAKYTLFAPDGTPLRATCNVSMEEMPPPSPKQNPTSGSVPVRGFHRVVAGETLAGLAYTEYHDAALWRWLADYNDIDDPARLRVGTRLVLPLSEDAPRGGGR